MPAVVAQSGDEFQHMLRVMNTNVDGKDKVPFAMRRVKGVGRRLAIMACKRAGVDMHRRAGTLSNDEIERVVSVLVHRNWLPSCTEYFTC
eukprot:TRINITY_DN40990_c0_g1_i1.p1 TRINITY_DN40990_c0_g1~~TRINITY_DN40990_c0_g1_i1.p1  ORF type:complete len:103 (+),score=10.51 TRINITY_DN40990_c0_g1_i1:41-310(+)